MINRINRLPQEESEQADDTISGPAPGESAVDVAMLDDPGRMLAPNASLPVRSWLDPYSAPCALRDTFERVFVLNLAARPDRWTAFQQRFPADWPFREPVRIDAVDGRLVPPPAWWKSGPGAWGCFRTHVALLEDCLNKNINSILLIEDDAMFVPNFRSEVQAFFAHLPDDWTFLYLGGEHLKQQVRLPRMVNEWVYRPYNVNRTHCFGIRGRATMEAVYRHLNAFLTWTAEHHIDHHLGELHSRMSGGLYVPRRWLALQSAGTSDINGKSWPALQSAGAEALTSPKIDLPMIAVAGPPCSGASGVAGILHHLGINMGTQFTSPRPDDSIGTYQAQRLSEICRMSRPEPWLAEDMAHDDCVNLLRRWAGDRCNELRGKATHAGGSYPSLCMLGAELLKAWDDPFFVAVDRPLEECIEAATDARHAGWPREAIQYALPRMVDQRDKFLKKYAPRQVRVAYDRLRMKPASVVDQLCEALGYRPTESQRQAALSFADQWTKRENPSPVRRAPGPAAVARPAVGRANPEFAPFVACIGLHRSGSSCVAGVLHHLGIHMGNQFVGCEADGGYEAQGLASLCERFMPFPDVDKKLDAATVAAELSRWIDERCKEAMSKGTIAGGKYPHLACMGTMLSEICRESLYVVHCERPLDESIASLVRREKTRYDRKRLASVQRYLWRQKRAFLAGRGLKIHTINYHALLSDPLAEVWKLARFLPITIDQSKVHAAASYVKPELQHVRLEPCAQI